MKQPIILIGGGGHCKACIDVIEQEGKYEIAGIVDQKEKVGQKILGYTIIGCDDDLPELFNTYKQAIITVGQIRSAKVRILLFEKLKTIGFQLPVIISPLAYVSSSAHIEEGSIVMHHALVNTEAHVGQNNIINSKALIEHESTIGKHNHISTACQLNGQVKVADECFIGSGSTIANNVSIVSNVIVPAGTNVYKNINKAGIYIRR
ncbi:NeuD/PglB/VioB family sugar acetyltransferase [Carboxylicivirga sp. M1479]|uniref:NeuD/PglB/VioB family sugar acetyltransferase n=1 Tax=Carboxylicivirga sp. M1479 TaxID=2594476 RepID=UPI0011778E12|nr:NeuD/PglB/VioB family sugar acetyltransferase [Carboxylicivirga sp. M1479]TRX70542.1 acetyltransferase [Carboxylicivirga sp. M1479]